LLLGYPTTGKTTTLLGVEIPGGSVGIHFYIATAETEAPPKPVNASYYGYC